MALLLVWFLPVTTVEAITTIRSLRFEGNDVTQELFLRRSMYLAEGDMFDEVCLSESLQSLRDTGLFKDVSYYISSDTPQVEQAADSQIDLVIIVREKHYLLVLPRFRVKDNERHIGIQLRWDNMHGMNHNLRFLAEDYGSVAGINERHNQLEYSYPNVMGSAYSLSFATDTENGVDEPDPGILVNRKSRQYSIGAQRWLNESRKTSGWFSSASWSVIHRNNDMLDVNLVDEQIVAYVLGLGLGFSEVHDYGYNRGGKEYGYNVDISHRILHSDEEYSKHVLYYRSYYRFPDRPMDNLNVQTILGHATHDILGAEAFSLGADDVRGYESGEFSGNALLQINMEYQVPAENRPRLRYVGFIDLANTYEEVSDVIHGGLHAGVGFGIRWKIPSFVKLDVRIDVGYGVAVGDYHVTAGTRYNF